MLSKHGNNYIFDLSKTNSMKPCSSDSANKSFVLRTLHKIVADITFLGTHVLSFTFLSVLLTVAMSICFEVTHVKMKL